MKICNFSKRQWGGECLALFLKEKSKIKTLELELQEGSCSCENLEKYLHQPRILSKVIQKNFAPDAKEVLVNGPFDNRIALIHYESSSILISFGQPLEKNHFIKKHLNEFKVETPNKCISNAFVPAKWIQRLKSPCVKLVALYHPENFPLPRFALGISDIARAIREEYMGQVTLSDMQLNKSVQDILNEITSELPDIIGISVTFGQQDVLEELLGLVEKIPEYKPLIAVGGSLAALNAERLVAKTRSLIVGLGDGESSFPDIIQYWYGDKKLNEISNVMVYSDGKVTKNPRSVLPSLSAGIPELDLLKSTLDCRGVMQLESTRGCSYACSFCPRAHKGIWIPQSESLFEKILPEVSEIYKHYPDISKKIFLVDEEFIGYRVEDETSARVLNVCNTMKKYGFTFETSARVDQVYRRTKDREWHIERMKLWNYLVQSGLDRVLFGVESGVDSILKRFNKNTMKFQNVNAIRILSSSNIPVRLTYITFDPLMTMQELSESFHFQGRRDLLINPLKETLSEAEIFDGIHDNDFIKANSSGQRLYRDISYMLVSMECLIGSKYTRKADEHGLAKEFVYSMGKRNADYLDKRIGLMSYNSQLWIDRNFALDYTIKSLEKISSKEKRGTIRNLRNVVKDYAYSLLGQFLAIANNDLSFLPTDIINDFSHIKVLMKKFDSSMTRSAHNQRIFEEVMDYNFDLLKKSFFKSYNSILSTLSDKDKQKMNSVINDWIKKSDWRLINAA